MGKMPILRKIELRQQCKIKEENMILCWANEKDNDNNINHNTDDKSWG